MGKTAIFTDSFVGGAGTSLYAHDALYGNDVALYNTFLDGVGGINMQGALGWFAHNINYAANFYEYLRLKFNYWTFTGDADSERLFAFLRMWNHGFCALELEANGNSNSFNIYVQSQNYSSNQRALIASAHTINNGDYIEFRVTDTDLLQVFINDVQVGTDVAATYDTGNAGTQFALQYHYQGAASGPVNISQLEVGVITATPPVAPTLLTATCSTGISETVLPNAPVASFAADVASGVAPLTVNFTDTSTNTPTSWLWQDETGVFSTSQNPTRVFAAGIHTVRLTATNAQGSTSYQATIIATATPVVTPPDGGTIIPSGLGPGGYFVVDTAGNQVKKYDKSGSLLSTFGGVGQATGQFFIPTTCSVINGRQLIDRVVIN